MTIKPLADKVVVKNLQAEETTKSGIILSSGAQQKPQVAEIIAVGPGGIVDGNEVKMEVKVGQKVIIRDYAGTNVKLEGEEYIVVRQDDIVAIVED
ncbi:MAG: co-chaperone GroES [Saccharofermentans sp.]|nr:co-chaperone GroES [Saccharofermentans sp.]